MIFSKLTALAMLCMLVVTMAIAGSGSALAQAQCTKYTVYLDPSIPPDCYPLTLKTDWGVPPTLYYGNIYPGPGTYSEFPPGGGVWPNPFNYATLDGDGQVPLGGTKVFILPCGCLKLSVGLDNNGCILIKVAKANCPS